MPVTAHKERHTSRRQTARRDAAQPRLGFLGLGWIGQHRLAAASNSGCVEIAAIADTNVAAIQSATQWAPTATVCDSFEMLLEQDLDGLVIATPSALHAEQAHRGLERGLAVFCQKPLARTAEETRRIVQQARSADRLLGVDFSYRDVAGVSQMRDLAQGGELESSILTSTQRVLDYLELVTEPQRRKIGRSARSRILAEHTGVRRAEQLEHYFCEALRRKQDSSAGRPGGRTSGSRHSAGTDASKKSPAESISTSREASNV